jgi:hypothetical protein
VVHTYGSYGGGIGRRIYSSRPGRKADSEKYPTTKRAKGTAQVVECLPSKSKVLSQTLVSPKQNNSPCPYTKEIKQQKLKQTKL